MIFGTGAIRTPGIRELESVWLLGIIVYGFGSLLIILSFIQIAACKTENRCLIFLVKIIYELLNINTI